MGEKDQPRTKRVERKIAYKPPKFKDDDDFLPDADYYSRKCCKLRPIISHNRELETNKHKWGEPKPVSTKKTGELDEKIKGLRRKQFFNFIADFYEKFENGELKGKAGNMKPFTPEEKERQIKKYFKKYYMENAVQKPVKMKFKVDTDQAAKKR